MDSLYGLQQFSRGIKEMIFDAILHNAPLDRLDEIADPQEFRETLSEWFAHGWTWEKYILDTIDFWDLTKSEIIRVLHGEKLRVRPYDI